MVRRHEALRRDTDGSDHREREATTRVVVYSDPIYLASERHAIERAAAVFLEKAGFELVPEADLDRLIRIANEGRRIKTGETCGAPTPAEKLLTRALPNVEQGVVFVTCNNSCTLKLTINERTNKPRSWRTKLPAHPSFSKVVFAMKSLVAFTPDPSEVYGGIMGTEGGASPRRPARCHEGGGVGNDRSKLASKNDKPAKMSPDEMAAWGKRAAEIAPKYRTEILPPPK